MDTIRESKAQLSAALSDWESARSSKSGNPNRRAQASLVTRIGAPKQLWQPNWRAHPNASLTKTR
jgi:hypothetical protein